MTMFANILTGAAGIAMVAGAAAPATAQAPYGGYQDPYNSGGGVVGAVIGQILGGGRYGAYGQGRDRVSVDQCARAAEARVSHDYRTSGYGNYPQQTYNDPRYGQAYGYNTAVQARVIGITAVERRSNGLKVSGVIDSGRSQYRGPYGSQAYGGYSGYGGQPYPNQAYPNQAYPGYGNAYGRAPQVADLRFSCRVDFRGYVTNVDIKRNVASRRNY